MLPAKSGGGLESGDTEMVEVGTGSYKVNYTVNIIVHQHLHNYYILTYHFWNVNEGQLDVYTTHSNPLKADGSIGHTFQSGPNKCDEHVEMNMFQGCLGHQCPCEAL